jgi:hypothetical protein
MPGKGHLDVDLDANLNVNNILDLDDDAVPMTVATTPSSSSITVLVGGRRSNAPTRGAWHTQFLEASA